MKFKITTLCENNIGHGSKNLIGEHGLSFYIEAGDRRILFDTGRNTIHAILGGLHLGKASDEKLLKIADHLDAFGLEKIGVGHCTGPKAFVALANEFKERVFLNTVGNVVEF